MYLKAILNDPTPLKRRWPEDAADIAFWYRVAEHLVNDWAALQDEFKTDKTLENKHLLIAMMYQPWELCDDVFTEWNEANLISPPAKNELRDLPRTLHYSA